METNTTEIPSKMSSDQILGLPVASFAYILVGAGIAAGLLFLIIFAVFFKYTKVRRIRRTPLMERQAKFLNIREQWEQDTRNRMENLKKAGYNNEAFQNIDDYQLYTVDEYTNIEKNSGDKYKQFVDESAKSNGNASLLMINSHGVNGDVSRADRSSRHVTFDTVPVMQINGTLIDDIDYEISIHSDMVSQHHLKRADDFFIGQNSGGKKSTNILVSAKSQQQIMVTDEIKGETKDRS